MEEQLVAIRERYVDNGGVREIEQAEAKRIAQLPGGVGCEGREYERLLDSGEGLEVARGVDEGCRRHDGRCSCDMDGTGGFTANGSGICRRKGVSLVLLAFVIISTPLGDRRQAAGGRRHSLPNN